MQKAWWSVDFIFFFRKFDFAGEAELAGLREDATLFYEELRKKYEDYENPGCYETDQN